MATESVSLTEDKPLKIYRYVADCEAIGDLHTIRAVASLMQSAIDNDMDSPSALPDGIIEGLQLIRVKATEILQRAGAH